MPYYTPIKKYNIIETDVSLNRNNKYTVNGKDIVNNLPIIVDGDVVDGDVTEPLVIKNEITGKEQNGRLISITPTEKNKIVLPPDEQDAYDNFKGLLKKFQIKVGNGIEESNMNIYDAPPWKEDTKYERKDEVSVKGTKYTCKSKHTARYRTQPGKGRFWKTRWKKAKSFEPEPDKDKKKGGPGILDIIEMLINPLKAIDKILDKVKGAAQKLN
jgi:hypothetical protein